MRMELKFLHPVGRSCRLGSLAPFKNQFALIQTLARAWPRPRQFQNRVHNGRPYGHPVAVTDAHELDIFASGYRRSLVPVLLYEQVRGSKDVDVVYQL